MAMDSYLLFFPSNGFFRFLDIYYFDHIRQYHHVAVYLRNKQIMYIYKLLLSIWLVLVMHLNHIVYDFIGKYKYINFFKNQATYSHFIKFFV